MLFNGKERSGTANKANEQNEDTTTRGKESW